MLTVLTPLVEGNTCNIVTGICTPELPPVGLVKNFPYVKTNASPNQLFKVLYRLTHTGSEIATVSGHNFVLTAKNSTIIASKSLPEFLVMVTEILGVINQVEQKVTLKNVTVTFGDECVVEVTVFDHPENNMNAVVTQILDTIPASTVTYMTV